MINFVWLRFKILFLTTCEIHTTVEIYIINSAEHKNVISTFVQNLKKISKNVID